MGLKNRNLNFALLLFVFTSSCENPKSTFQPIADGIKKYMLENVPEIKSVDTMHLVIDTVTPRVKCVIQSAEYSWASTEAKRAGLADSAFFEAKADSVMDLYDKLDSNSFLYYRARPLVICTKNNLEREMASKWLYFDKNFKQISKYSFIEKASNVDNESLVLFFYAPFSEQGHDTYKKGIYLIYY